MTVGREKQDASIPEPCHNFPVALDLAKRGLCVFPITLKGHGSWTPEFGWQAMATSDPATIANWFKRWPDARIGLPCGERNGISVLDVDEKNGKSGSATLAALGFPDVESMSPVRVRTPSGGWHLIFRYDPRLGNSVGERGLGLALDVKTEGGFVVAPGSYKAGKRYEPQGSTLGTIDLPAWPEALIPAAKPEYNPATIVANPTDMQVEWAAGYLGNLAARLAETAEGQRHFALNNAALWAGGAGAHGFLSREQAEATLLTAAKIAGLPDREARATFKTAWSDGVKKGIAEYPREADIDDSDFEDFGGPAAMVETMEDMIGPYPSEDATAPVRGKSDGAVALAEQLPAAPAAKADLEPATSGRDPGGDFALSRSFVAKVKGAMRYDRAARHFMAYSDAVGAWRRCERGEEEQAMLSCARKRFDKACAVYRADPSDINERKQTEVRSYLKNANLLTRALGMAKGHVGLVCLPTDFNTDPYSFPVANGLLNLRSGKLTPPAADLMISKQSPVRFDPAAVCLKFDKFLLRIMPDVEVRKFLQLAVGYTITGLVDEERLFLCHGKGANGKSVFANIIAALMGESATGFSVTVDPLTFVKGSRGGESDRNVVALIGKRLCLVNEIPQGSVWDDGKVKLLTSREQIAARHLYAENVNFWPSHTLWVRANSLPGAHDASDGFWRRVVPVPFTTQIPEDERVGDLDRQIMREELPGVLNWALAGARAYLAAGRLVIPKSLTRLTAQYRDSCDVLGQWFDDCLIIGDGARMQSGDAYRAYRAYCADQGVTAPAQIAFSRTMGERGFPSGKGTGGLRIFNGLKLRTGFDDHGQDAPLNAPLT